MSASAAMWGRECHYERLHQIQRLEELEALERVVKLDWFQRELLRLTRAFLANPIGGSGGRFDLTDVARIAELDAFARATASA